MAFVGSKWFAAAGALHDPASGHAQRDTVRKGAGRWGPGGPSFSRPGGVSCWELVGGTPSVLRIRYFVWLIRRPLLGPVSRWDAQYALQASTGEGGLDQERAEADGGVLQPSRVRSAWPALSNDPPGTGYRGGCRYEIGRDEHLSRSHRSHRGRAELNRRSEVGLLDGMESGPRVLADPVSGVQALSRWHSARRVSKS